MMAFYGLYYALTQPVMKAIVVDTVPQEMRGRAFGMFYFVTSVAALLASVITGALWKRFGAALPFHVSAVLALIAAILLLATPKLFRQKRE
jgi:MFS family permease